MLEYWRGFLNPSQKQLYDKLVMDFKAGKSKIDCPKNISPNEIQSAYEAVNNDHPELFYIPHNPSVAQSVGLFGSSLTLMAKSIYSSLEISYYNDEISNIKRVLSQQIQQGATEIEKEKVICDYLVKGIQYEIDNKHNQNAGTALVKKKGQCSGIAKATMLLCNSFGIECIVVNGQAKSFGNSSIGPHMWNIVKIGGKHYHLDVTAMIGSMSAYGISYSYFNIDDATISKTHNWDRRLVPKCTHMLTPSKENSSSSYHNRVTDAHNGSSPNTMFDFSENLPEVLSLAHFKEMLSSELKKGSRNIKFKSLIAGQYDMKNMLKLYSSSCKLVLDRLGMALQLRIEASSNGVITISCV